MDLQHHLNFLYIVFAVQLLCDCFALDLVRKITRKPRGWQASEKGDIKLLDKSNTKSNVYNDTDSLTRYPYKKKEGGISQKNLRMVIVSWRNIKGNKSRNITTSVHHRNNTFVPRYNSQSTTPSYIEFDYFDELDDKKDIPKASFNRFDRFATDNRITKSDKFKTSTRPTRQSFFSIRFNGPYSRKAFVSPQTPSILGNFQNFLLYPRIEPVNNLNTEKEFERNYKNISTGVINKETVRDQKQTTMKYRLMRTRSPTTTINNEQKMPLKLQLFYTMPPFTNISTIPDDRVKFFEMYDNNTIQPPEKGRYLSETNQIETLTDDNYFPIRNSIENKNNHVNRRNCDSPREIKHEENKQCENSTSKTESSQERNASKSVPTLEQNSTFTLADNDASTNPLNKLAKSGFITVKIANWSSYAFASVYVFKPTQTHCDAAAISPHWLVAAGSCLSRHRLIHTQDKRSAFVTYCGQYWKPPERIAYVKRTAVHPKFRPRDGVRRLLYNIGLIQVSSSMTSCPGWSPVTFKSHQFTTEPAGSIASAVGWGLDRYGTKYSSEELPQWPLTVYEALVFSDICPGSTSYSMVEQNGASNVYCLLLPPYVTEETDPVHGGLLLVGGKLVALYLQEERRSSGAQSAQYTGIWRLLPWVKATAREPHDDVSIRSGLLL